jgi:hypothetical protein
MHGAGPATPQLAQCGSASASAEPCAAVRRRRGGGGMAAQPGGVGTW